MIKKGNKFEFKFQEFIDLLPGIMLIINAESGKIVEVNEAAVDYYGYPREQILTMNISDINVLEENNVKKEMTLALNQRRHFFRFKHRLADNSIRDVEVHSFPMKSNKESLLFSIVHDVNEKVKQEYMFEQLLVASPYAVAVLDKEQRIIQANKNFINFFQYSTNEIEGKFINSLVSPVKDRNQIDKNLISIFQGQIIKQEGKRRRKDRSLVDVEIIGYPVVYNQSVEGAYIIYMDISHRYKDSLTGLYNRNYFIEEIDNRIKVCSNTKQGFSIVTLHIENFKIICDTFGHIMEDKLLVKIAKRLKETLNGNYLISRIESSEFAILVNNTGNEFLNYFSTTILNNLSQCYKISDTKIYLNFNIGISSFPCHGTNSEDLMRFSNAAMHQTMIKSNSKINFYNNEISEIIEQKFFMANYLFSAISNNELSIRYQPIFEINDKTIVGAEALLRWNNSILGEVPPSNFIPISERTGQIVSIGEWVIKEVCRQINLWEQKGFKLIPISINISVKQLEIIDFAETTIEIMESYGIEPKNIELEITEGVSSGDIAKIVKNIKQLKKHGLKISMDDFGTGFSSLGQLDIFQLDKLKIDKIFIDDLRHGSTRQNLVKTIIVMAESLNLITVAEGIETCEQLGHLRGMGCDLGQGYLFSQPLIVEDIEKILAKDIPS